MDIVVYVLIYLGSALMAYNIYGFVRFAIKTKAQSSWKGGNIVLYVPIMLLTLFKDMRKLLKKSLK